MADLPTFSRGRQPGSVRWRNRRNLIKKAVNRFAWFTVLTALMVAGFITTIVSMMQIQTLTADGADRVDEPASRTGEAGGGPKLWLLGQIFTSTLASVAAAVMAVYPSATRGRGWFGTFVVLVGTLVCAILVLPIYLRVSAYWGEFLGLACIFLVSVVFCMTAARLRTQAAAARRSAQELSLEDR